MCLHTYVCIDMCVNVKSMLSMNCLYIKKIWPRKISLNTVKVFTILSIFLGGRKRKKVTDSSDAPPAKISRPSVSLEVFI